MTAHTKDTDWRIPTVVHIKEGCDIYIGRPSKWGNPYHIGLDGDRNEVINKYRTYLLHSTLIKDLHELYGKRLGCFCHPRKCHGDVLVEFITLQLSL